MNPLEKAINIKKGAEKSLQGLGKKVGTSMRSRAVKNAAKGADYFKKTGSYPG